MGKISKEKLKKYIGKKITVSTYYKKMNIENTPGKPDDTREIWTFSMPPKKVLIIGFTHLCEGTLYWGTGDSSTFTCTKKVPVIKTASGFAGNIMYVPMSELERV